MTIEYLKFNNYLKTNKIKFNFISSHENFALTMPNTYAHGAQCSFILCSRVDGNLKKNEISDTK